MRPRRTVPSVLVAVVVVAALAGPAHTGHRSDRARAKTFSFVNHFRRHAGRKPLKNAPALTKLAWNHSLHMARSRRLFHTRSLSIRMRAWHPRVYGENVGVGPSIWRVFKMWTKSKPHRANLLDRRFTHAGVGVIHTHNAYWMTMIFYGH
jgi:uncharacterized protein YkwD